MSIRVDITLACTHAAASEEAQGSVCARRATAGEEGAGGRGSCARAKVRQSKAGQARVGSRAGEERS
jgi:hypothetical protein